MTYFKSYLKLFLLQNHSGECISIGSIPDHASTDLRLAEIWSLVKVIDSAWVITLLISSWPTDSSRLAGRQWPVGAACVVVSIFFDVH